ncbi:MAG TPA: alpha/beta hydrolase [Actinomycetota bacterium]|nr:alpha/beta hydrolase [Actinomycetota bacterium]
MTSSHFVDLNGTRVHYLDEGKGDPPFVLVHGWGSSVVKWRDTVPLLAQDRRTLAIDLPGFGRSDIPEFASYSPGWMAGAVRAFMDTLGIERTVLVGNSLGGLASVYFAAAWPERVAGLVLAAAALPNDRVEDPKALLQMLAPGVPGVGPALYRRWLRTRTAEQHVAEGIARNCAEPTRVSKETLALLEEEMHERLADRARIRPVTMANRHMMWVLGARRERTWRIVRSLRVPTLLVWGDQDRLLPVSIAERAVQAIPGAELVVMPVCGHNPQVELPVEFSGVVTSFARRIAAPATR